MSFNLKNVSHYLDCKHWKAGIHMALTSFHKFKSGSYLVFGTILLFDISVIMDLTCYPQCLTQSTHWLNNEMNKVNPKSMTQRFLKLVNRDLIHTRPQGSRPFKLMELNNVEMKRKWPRFQLCIEKILTSKGYVNRKQWIDRV